AKSGIGIEEILEQIVEYIPSPDGDSNKSLQALIFDSVYDPYRGVVVSVRIKNGSVKPGDKIKMMSTGSVFDVTEVGIHTPKEQQVDELTVGDVGYICASIKNVSETSVGDTIT
ncbi:elongation factor 4, partial [Streptococcus danieliae]|nr:elongation factor 4 [Streptococcus danieliae]